MYVCMYVYLSAGYSAFFTPLLNELRGGDLQGLSKKEIEVTTQKYYTIYTCVHTLHNRHIHSLISTYIRM